MGMAMVVRLQSEDRSAGARQLEISHYLLVLVGRKIKEWAAPLLHSPYPGPVTWLIL